MTHDQVVSIPLHRAATDSPTDAQPVAVAVPFAMGAVQSASQVWLANAAGESLPCSITTTGVWPDQSVKWCVVKWAVQGHDNGMDNLTLRYQREPATTAPPPDVVAEESSDHIRVSAGELTYEFERSGESVFPTVFRGESAILSGKDVAIDYHADGDFSIRSNALKVVSVGPASANVQIDAEIVLSANRHLQVTFKYEICGDWLKAAVQVHNPHRAKHPGAIWELGDEGSICFDEFALSLACSNSGRVHWAYERGMSSEPVTEAAVLLQASSGGEHWDSPTHVDASGKVPNRFKGYRVDEAGVTVASGDRASPQVRVELDDASAFALTCRHYWQNFPKCIEVQGQSIRLGLFPRQHSARHEMQGGERKQHEVVFAFGRHTALDWVDDPAVISVPAEYIATTGVLRYTDTLPGTSVRYGEAGYDQVLGTSHDEAVGFMAKREQIDEYGWRNFGDIFADHETLYHEADDIFVSHYNNQYDPIYGFARQYLLSGDKRWHELLTDLAQHVLDIDIYRTDEDRAEYNHGLFWHTDHYKRAYTCSHRTYARKHYPSDWSGDMGGGPGSEHCYTSGLLLYYQLTGDTDARDAVLGLTSWIRHYYEGTGTVLEAGKRLATDDRRNAIAICRGHQVFKYQYGFDRGVGNYIRALLDSYEITYDRQYLEQAERVVQGTFGSNDDIAARDLDDIEGTWYYTVFLQEVIRYLDLKRTMEELDDSFRYARGALLHYAHWMADNEQPYLSQPDRLEYPNDTWIAQDIRKANVLYAAYRYATTERARLLQQAKFFRDYVVEHLSRSDTRHFARIQIILLQNHGPSNLMDVEAAPYDGLDRVQADAQFNQTCFFTPTNFTRQLLAGWGRALINFNPKKEIKWVRARLG